MRNGIHAVEQHTVSLCGSGKTFYHGRYTLPDWKKTMKMTMMMTTKMTMTMTMAHQKEEGFTTLLPLFQPPWYGSF